MSKNNLTVSDMFPSRFIKSSDVGDSELELTIDRVSFEEMGDRKENKPVLFFKEIDQGLVLNKSNAKTIASLYGNNVDEWSDKKVKLYTTQVIYQGTSFMGIRVRLKPHEQ